MTRPRLSIAAVMVVVVVLAADLAALRATLPLLPNPGLVFMVAVLEVGLLRMASRRDGPRPFWLGFEAVGWTYVLTCLACDRPLWRLARRLYEAYALGRPIGRPAEMTRLILVAGVVQLVLAAAAAIAGGVVAHRLHETRGAA